MTPANFNPARLTLLRERAGMTKEELAAKCGVTRRAVTGWESGQVATPPLLALAELFHVSPDFFGMRDAPDLDTMDVSFRALSSAGARKTKRVIAAARLSLELNQWLDSEFQSPDADIPSMDDLTSPLHSDDYSPEQASKMLRNVWSLADRPIKNMLWLLEGKGVRVFGLPGEDRDVDAFSFWRAGRPFIFLNPEKSAERLRFDLAHELGHLILHKGVPTARERSFEMQANQFASAFLMPATGLLAQASTGSGEIRLADVFVMKKSWRVSATAMVRRLFDLKLIGDWHYRTWMVDLSSRGYRRGEPDGVHPEQSRFISSLLSVAREQKMSLRDMATFSGVPERVIQEAFAGLAIIPISTGSHGRRLSAASASHLSVVQH